MTRIPSVMNAARSAVVHPARKAALPALVYVALCAVYIVASSRIAAAVATSTEQLQAIEAVKGIAFVVVTGILFFVVAFAMLKRIQSQEAIIMSQERALLQAERRNVAAMCSATLAHDINNLLLTLRGWVDEIRILEARDPSLAAMRRDLETAIENLRGLSRRMASAASRVMPDKPEVVDMRAVLGNLVALARKHIDVRFCTLILTGADVAPLPLNRALFEEAVLNLVVNAAQAAGRKGRIELLAAEADGVVSLQVHDNGPGVPEAQARAIFDPCFTTKPDGTGLGLVTVQAFAASCGGKVQVSRSPLGGALFEIRIPRNALPVAAQPGPG